MQQTIKSGLLVMAMTGCGGPLPESGNGAEMLPGQNCVGCHKSGGEAQAFSVAGTIYDSPNAKLDDGTSGVDVLVTDAKGVQITLTTNRVGNFYSTESLQLPYRVEIQKVGLTTRKMTMAVEQSGCNSCHKQDPTHNAPGRIFID